MVYKKKIDQDMLVKSAFELLEREGAEALSMRRLATLLDVRASSLYNHFHEKSALLSAVAEKGLFLLAAELERVSALAKSDPRRQIYAMGMTYREWALQHPQLYRLLFTNTPPIEDTSSSSPIAAFAPILTATGKLVGQSQAASATQAVWAFVHGYVLLELTGHLQQCIPVEGFQLGLSCFVQGLGR
ncbi:TetR/AcrR family transcriptional regulator [Paenibacillus nasutitermitis]|uniref:TetR family transcriptional regulator n=1 Tax=Paenibacillus nasutitermitis TaxID=1652958 RepID=A0A917E281_9BACL|nr:TetR/AcrR family transcriptional regulator [Paenibacillus nasutitermitis]GGD97682.1 TetR family transcriptional regulator [Paenibacillus nasutitermitis]